MLPIGRRQGYDRHDVCYPDAGMDAVMLAQIDELNGTRDSCQERLRERARLAGKRKDRAVMIGVRVHVEKRDLARESPPDLVDCSRVTPLGNVRHGFEHDPYPTST